MGCPPSAMNGLHLSPLVPGEDLPLGLPVGARHHQVKARSWSVFIVRPQPGTPSCALRRCSEPLGWQGLVSSLTTAGCLILRIMGGPRGAVAGSDLLTCI